MFLFLVLSYYFYIILINIFCYDLINLLISFLIQFVRILFELSFLNFFLCSLLIRNFVVCEVFYEVYRWCVFRSKFVLLDCLFVYGCIIFSIDDNDNLNI